MKVNIGPYRDWFGAYQLAELLMFWAKNDDNIDYDDPVNVKARDKVHAFGEWLATDKHGNVSKLQTFLEWFHSKKKRKIKVVVHNYDTWNAYETIAVIVLPLLKKLKEVKHGSGLIDDKDVPAGKNLRSTESPNFKKDEPWNTDDNLSKRYDYVLDEIIWALEQLQPDYDWEAQFHSGFIDLQWEPCKDNNKLSQMIKGPKDTHKFDRAGYMKHSKRIDNGLRLFGKYFRTLWD